MIQTPDTRISVHAQEALNRCCDRPSGHGPCSVCGQASIIHDMKALQSALTAALTSRAEARQERDALKAELAKLKAEMDRTWGDDPERCENCGTPILDEGDSRTTGDDVLLCNDCYEDCP